MNDDNEAKVWTSDNIHIEMQPRKQSRKTEDKRKSYT